jgi:RNA polymerase sigma-70 factor (ECF subfamily)
MQCLQPRIPSHIPEDDEIKRIAQSNRRLASDLIVRKYRTPIFHHAAYIVKDYEEAIDVAQEVFIKALREQRFFNPDFKMKAWLYRVTSNLCFNLVRDRKRRSAILETYPRKNATDARQVDKVMATEQEREIKGALSNLSENHRKILILRYYSDLSYSEIAGVLEIKLGTVMSRLSRAKRSLVEVLSDMGVEQASLC